MDADIEGILKENERRLAERDRAYDPVGGDPDDPERVWFPVKGLESYIPATMERELFTRELLRFGSVDNYLREMKGAVTPELREQTVKRWERLRCLHDFPYWAATRAYIKRKGGGDDMLFVLNRPQRKLVAALEKMRRGERPIRLILLKARQWGGSTCVQLYMAWLQLVHEKGLNSLIIAHLRAATDEIKDMFDRMLAHYPPEETESAPAGEDDGGRGGRKKKRKDAGKMTEKVGSSGAAFRVVHRNCKIKVGTAETPDSSRGGDYNLVHCSEVALWKSTPKKMPEDIVRAATSGVLLRPMTMIVYESTANGTGNFFHEEYKAAKKGVSQFTPVFVAWHEIEQNTLPFADEEERREFAVRLYEGRGAEQASDNRRQPGAYLWWLWEKGAALESINWYVGERAKFSDHGLMASECPSDDIEAFVHSGARVFDRYKVDVMRGDCREPSMRGEIDGDAPSGPESLSGVRFSEEGNGALEIWADREVRRGERVAHRYLAVVDIGGRSLSADWSVVAVFDRLPMISGGRPEVVAQWRGHTDFDLLAWNAARIARYYDNALLVVESNTLETHDPFRSGESEQSSFLLNRLREAYPNLYARRPSEDDIRRGAPVKYGFHTNTATKPMIISMLVQAIREGLYVERDERCLEEYLTYEQRQNGSYGALPGNHDDLLMTRAIGLHICMREMPLPRILPEPGGGVRPRPVSAAVF